MLKEIIMYCIYIERMETELELFTQSLDDRNLSQGTINTYIKLYNKLYAEINDDLHNLSQSKMLETLIDMEIESVNTYNSLLNIFILIRKLYKLNTDELTTKRMNNKPIIKKHIEQKFEEDDLPSYETLINDMNEKLKKFQLREYIICFLLLHYGVRNKDINIKFTSLKRDTNKERNWIWIKPRGKCIYFINDYKTAGVYGSKVIEIDDKEFNRAVRMFYRTGERDLIPIQDYGHFIQNATYNKIGEIKYFKVLVAEFWNDKNKIQQLAITRGTNIETILNNYKGY
jgi:hypothetical protein